MKQIINLLFLLLTFGNYTFGQDSLSTDADNSPNILLIIADDLGFSDIGAFGGEIATPILNQLATMGIKFSNFHTLPTCSPTRSVLMTGTDNHIAGIGGQQPGGVTEKQKAFPGYEGYLNDRVAVLPEVLKAAGYRTYHVGKWHLGTAAGKRPFDRGFQESFTLLSGGASHYADRKPLHPAEPALYSRNGQLLDELPADFYSTKNYTDSVLTWMKRDKNANKPFFAHLAYTAPHDPLHAPRAYIDKYKGKYDEGYEVLQKTRFEQLKKLGLITQNHRLPAWLNAIPKWSNLSLEEQQAESRNMEIYAAMVDYLDEQIGRIYQWLETNGELDNTFIVFMSDNGANGAPASFYPSYTPEFGAQFDNSLANRGMSNSFTDMGAGWAAASTSAFRLFKLFSTEGGIRTPMIIKPATTIVQASLPKTANAAAQIEMQLPKISHSFIHVKDLMPTFLSLADAAHPATQNPKLAKMSGQSLIPLLTGKINDLHGEKGIGYELHASRAYIKGDWKILQIPMPLGSSEWELYNLKNDPGESNNLVFSERDKFKELLVDYENYEKENGVIYDLPLITGPIKQAFTLMFWLIIAIFSLASLHKLSGRLKDKYHAWGYGTNFMYSLAIVELLGLSGLFSRYIQYAAWFLLLIMVGAFFTLIKNKENWNAYLLPLFATFLLSSILWLKSGWFIRFLL